MAKKNEGKTVKNTKTSRGLASRKPEDYDNRTEGRRSSSIPPGDFTLNEGLAPVNLIRPKYEDGPLVFRPWPCLDYENPETRLQPARKSAEPRSQTNWIVRMMTASYVGIKDGGALYTFNLYHPKDKEGRISNPYRIFHRACEQAHDAGKFGTGRKWNSEWNKLLKGSKKGGAAISPPKVKWFVQGHVYVNGDKLYIGGDSERDLPLGLDPRDDLTVFQISDTAGDGLMDLLDIRKSEWEGDEEADPTVCFKYGGATGHFDEKKRILTGGLFVTIFNPKKTKIKKATSWSGEIKEIQGYEAAVSRRWSSDDVEYTPDIDSKGVDQIFAKSQFWFDDPDNSNNKGLLRIPPVEQQCLWIAQAFKPVPQLVSFAFADHEEFLTEEVKAVLRNRVSMVVPGDDDEDEDEEETTSKKSKKTDPVAKKGKKVVEDEDEDEDEEDEFEDDSDDEDSDDDADDEDEEDEKPAKKGKKPAKDEDDDEDDDEDSDDEDDDEDSDDEDDDSDDEDEDSDDEEDDEDDDEDDEKPAKKGGKASKKPSKDDDEDSDDDEDEDSDDEDDDSDEDSDDEDDDEDEEDEEEEDEKPAKKGGKASSKPASKPSKEEAEKPAKKGGKKGDEEDYFGVDDKTSKSAKAAKEAKGRSESRSQAPKKDLPKPPPTKGGTAKKGKK